jgi:hypothetical protein
VAVAKPGSRQSAGLKRRPRSLADFCFDAADGDPIKAIDLALAFRERFGDRSPQELLAHRRYLEQQSSAA